MVTKVAVVTGGNKGIGYAIVRGLCKRFEGIVYLTSRDEQRGQEAVKQLASEGLSPSYHQLDITEPKSIEKLRDYLVKEHGGFDLLVNNAAIAFKHDATEPAGVQAEETLRVNYFAVLNTCDILFPILRNGARVVNLSSSAGHLTMIPSPQLRRKFADPNLTTPELTDLVKRYIEEAKLGTQVAEWGGSSYAVSKVAVSALTKIQQRQLASRDIKVNSVHPGYVDTDMTSHKGPLTIDQGAEAPLWLALDAPDSVRGEYVWKNKEVVSWVDNKPAIY